MDPGATVGIPILPSIISSIMMSWPTATLLGPSLIVVLLSSLKCGLLISANTCALATKYLRPLMSAMKALALNKHKVVSVIPPEFGRLGCILRSVAFARGRIVSGGRGHAVGSEEIAQEGNRDKREAE